MLSESIGGAATSGYQRVKRVRTGAMEYYHTLDGKTGETVAITEAEYRAAHAFIDLDTGRYFRTDPDTSLNVEITHQEYLTEKGL